MTRIGYFSLTLDGYFNPTLIALHRKEQVEIIYQKKQLKYRSGTLAQFLDEYVELYGHIHWACSTYSSNTALIRNYIIPFFGTMQLHEFSPKVIAVIYSQLQRNPKITPQLMNNIHKLLHSAFEQAVLWEYLDYNPFKKANIPKIYSQEIAMLSLDQIANSGSSDHAFRYELIRLSGCN